MTDAEGFFEFGELPSCAITLTATYPGYVPGVYGQSNPGAGLGRTVFLGSGKAIRDLTFRIAKAGAISGRVLNAYGDPAIGVRVEAVRLPWGGAESPQAAGGATCDDRGEFRVFGLPPGNYLLRALPTGPHVGEDYLILAGLRTAPSGDLIRALNRLASESRNRSQGAHDVSDAGPVSPVAPVYYPGTEAIGAAQRLTVDVSDQLTGIDFRLRVIHTIDVSGTVTNNGQPIPPGTRVSIANAGLCCTTAAVEPDGTFVIRGVVPGSYGLHAWSQGGARLERGRFVGEALPFLWATTHMMLADSSAHPVLSLSPGIRVEGSLTVADGLSPMPFATEGTASPPTVSLTLVRGPDEGLPSIDVTAIVTPPGRFEFQGVPPGRYRVRARPGPFRLQLRSAMLDGRDVLDDGLDVPPFGIVSGLRLIFSHEVSHVSGQVGGWPLAASGNVHVVAFPVEDTYWGAGSRRVEAVVPDEEGRFAIDGLPPGDYWITVLGDTTVESLVDSAVLRRLSQTATRFTVRDGTPTTVNVVLR